MSEEEDRYIDYREDIGKEEKGIGNRKGIKT